MLDALPLPPLAGTRKRAQDLLSQLPDDLRGIDVVFDCRGLVASTRSFADELVSGVLVQRNAHELRFVNVDDLEFARWVDESAAARKVSDRYKVDRRAC